MAARAEELLKEAEKQCAPARLSPHSPQKAHDGTNVLFTHRVAGAWAIVASGGNGSRDPGLACAREGAVLCSAGIL